MGIRRLFSGLWRTRAGIEAAPPAPGLVQITREQMRHGAVVLRGREEVRQIAVILCGRLVTVSSGDWVETWVYEALIAQGVLEAGDAPRATATRGAA